MSEQRCYEVILTFRGCINVHTTSFERHVPIGLTFFLNNFVTAVPIFFLLFFQNNLIVFPHTRTQANNGCHKMAEQLAKIPNPIQKNPTIAEFELGVGRKRAFQVNGVTCKL